MHATGRVEGGLHRAQPRGRPGEQRTGERGEWWNRAALLDQVVDALPAAEAAGGAGERAAAGGIDALEHEVCAGRGRHVDRVAVAVFAGAPAVEHLAHVVQPSQQAFREEETGRQLHVGARRSHGDGDPFARHADVERLLDGDGVLDRSASS
jgi:hypothetical protein